MSNCYKICCDFFHDKDCKNKSNLQALREPNDRGFKLDLKMLECTHPILAWDLGISANESS